jgi:hypothetical protein
MTLWTCGSNVSGAFSDSRKWVLPVPVDHFVSQLVFLNLCRCAMCGRLSSTVCVCAVGGPLPAILYVYLRSCLVNRLYPPSLCSV